MGLRFLAAALLFVSSLAWSSAGAVELPRVVLGLYDGALYPYRFSQIHQMAEMPLNHLGLVVRPHDVREPLPPIESMTEVRGILTAFTDDAAFADPEAYLAWLERASASGKRVVVLNLSGVDRARDGRAVPLARINRAFARAGFRFTREVVGQTYAVRVAAADATLVNFEAPLPRVLPSYTVTAATGTGQPHLVLRDSKGRDSHAIITSPGGGYAAPGYAYVNEPEGTKRQWFMDPFMFFRLAFATDEVPKPDATTVSGRRIYYSHVDGDGWRNQSQVERWAKRGPAMSIDVMIKEVVEPYPDLPVSVGPIAGDLDPEWYGEEELMGAARSIFALPQVEAASHTYSHPFDWPFFYDYTPEKEAPLLSLYPQKRTKRRSGLGAWLGTEKPQQNNWSSGEGSGDGKGKADDKYYSKAYRVPRAYAVKPYDLDLEIKGSLDYIRRFLMPGKKVEVLLWSGNTWPDERTLAAVREAGIVNLNGGDSRFDAEFPSHGWVAPIGRIVGREIQIYASNSNENTYTGLWTTRFFGLRHVEATFRNTERPQRLKPMNLYYHVYSADRDGSLEALLRILELVRASEVAPIEASRFARIGDGFFRTRIEALSPERWRVNARGALQTIRFDRAAMKSVDFARSEGVIGQRHYQGSLYVALDEAHAAPVIALSENGRTDVPPEADRPYLIDARWRVFALEAGRDGFGFKAQGYGAGEMRWWVPVPGRYRLEVLAGATAIETVEATVGADRVLAVRLSARTAETVTIRARRLG